MWFLISGLKEFEYFFLVYILFVLILVVRTVFPWQIAFGSKKQTQYVAHYPVYFSWGDSNLSLKLSMSRNYEREIDV